MAIYAGVNGATRRISHIDTGVNGTARHVPEVYVGVNGVKRKAFTLTDSLARIEFRSRKISKYIKSSDTFEEITTSSDSIYGSYSISNHSIQVSGNYKGYGLAIAFEDYAVFTDGHSQRLGIYECCKRGYTFSISYSGTVSVTTNSTYPQGTYILWSLGTDLGPGSFNGSASYSKTITSSTSSVVENVDKLYSGNSVSWSLEVGAGLVSGSGTQYTTLNLPSTMTIDGVSVPCMFVDDL